MYYGSAFQNDHARRERLRIRHRVRAMISHGDAKAIAFSDEYFPVACDMLARKFGSPESLLKRLWTAPADARLYLYRIVNTIGALSPNTGIVVPARVLRAEALKPGTRGAIMRGLLGAPNGDPAAKVLREIIEIRRGKPLPVVDLESDV